MQYFNSKSNKKSDEVNNLGADKNVLGSIDMFNFDKVKNETSFTEKKTARKAELNEENIDEEENFDNQENLEEESNQWTKNMVTEKLNQLETEKPNDFISNGVFPNTSEKKSLDTSLSDQMFNSYKLNNSANSISISDEELNIKDPFLETTPSIEQGFSFDNEESKAGKFFEELDNDAITLGIYDTNGYYDFDMNSINESELYREGLADDSMSVGSETLYFDEPEKLQETVLENKELEQETVNNLYKEEPSSVEKDFIKSNELDFESTDSEDLVSDEELKQFSLEIEEEFQEEEIQNEIEIDDEDLETEELKIDDDDLEIIETTFEDEHFDEEELNSLEEELNFIENYCKEHGFPVTDNEKDLTKFLSKSNSGEISKIKTIVDEKEFFYISSIIAKVLYTDSILLLEKDKDTALNLLEGICLYCVDLEVSKLALLKLKEMLEIDNNISRLRILINNMCDKEQELLKVIYWF